ncbi:hypothetical protein HC251_09780 [Iamia sp. SCSIO 61187]|uniref:hypothetical protein n=1 Tax=Iamia sp. SCSIO 61187 TaxID=2722752 RepID=UPI001C63863E|nr:hypothetical protein [Iamia sp. SCSIO 61187]QYG92692.1 hypothetical protein HC251_09780 [Iamia sp. SCSIO 61187]
MTSKVRIAVLAAVVVVAAAVVSIAVVASNGEQSRDTSGRPGSSLGDGFTVVEGTTLIGDPIPIGTSVAQSGTEVIDEGWTASLVIDGGDPMEILDTYLRQAEATGLVGETGPGCALDQDVTICSMFARAPEPDQPHSFTARVVRGLREDVLSNHVVLRFATTYLYWQYIPTPAGGRVSEVPAAPSERPLAEVGDGLGTAGELQHEIVVQEGSRLAGPPHLNLDDGTGGVEVVLEVTGDPRQVLDLYLGHLGERAGHSDPAVQEIGAAVVTTAFAGGGGGDGFELTLVEREGRPTWLAISASHD